MSSPIAKTIKSYLDNFLIYIHSKLSRNKRKEHLIKIISSLITRTPSLPMMELLDCGCGDMTIAKGIANTAGFQKVTCMDIYTLPEKLANDPYWTNYVSYNGCDIPFSSKCFSHVLLLDVLHHVEEDMMKNVLCEALRVGQCVIVKDHFESGYFSRLLLLAMDFVGNKGYGVKLPKKYFSQKSYAKLLEDVGATVIAKHDAPIDYYQNGFLSKLLPSHLHFCHMVRLKTI